METTRDYIEAYGIQSSGSGGSFKLKILLDIGRDFTDVDTSNIRKCANDLEKLIREETLKHDPKSKQESNENRKEILELFDGHTIFVEEIPNGYCSDFCCKHLPWFVVTTKAGRITIGWRKRVIEINWKDSIISAGSMELFPKEEVTRGDKYIHAWGYEKAKEYINVLLTSY